MDKYEYRVKTEQMLEYMEKKQYKKAMEIADTIDWRRVKNASMLNNVSEIYEYNGEYQKSRDVLFMAYDRAPGSRKTVYRLGTLALKINDTDEASDCYEEFVRLAPKDPNQFILKYKILKARRAPLSEQIEALEDFKKAEYVEKWAYELAKLYHEAGMTAECLEECDDLILWFSEGKYVYQAMELKMKYKPLTPLQQEKYDSMRGVPSHTLPRDRAAEEEPGEEPDETSRESAEDTEDEGQAAPEETEQSLFEQRAPETSGTIDAETREIRLDELRAAREQAAQASAAAEEGSEAEEPRRSRKKVKEDSPIRKTVKGATLAEALANGVKVASGMDIEDIEKKASPKRDEDMRITGQMKIEEILAAWEAKQKDNAEAIEAQKKRDEEKLAEKKREAQRRREEEARRIEEQQRAAEEARRIAEQKAAEEARRLAEEQAEQERILAKQQADEEKRLARQKAEEEEALLDRIASGQVTAELKEAVKNAVPREEAEEAAEEETVESELETEVTGGIVETEEAEYEEADFEAEQEPEYEEADFEAEQEPEYEEAECEEAGDEEADFEAEQEPDQEEDSATGMTADLRQLMEELEAEERQSRRKDEPSDFDDEFQAAFEEESYEEADFEDEDDYEEADFEAEDDYGEADFEDEESYGEADFEDEDGYGEADFEDEDDYEEADFEDEDGYEEDDLVDDYEDYDDIDDEDYDDDFFDEEEEPEEEIPEEPDHKLTRKEKRAQKKAEKEAAKQARRTEELVIEEPTEEEIQRRIQKGKGGVPFDTGFVVTGRYDLSATSEIGLKAGLTEEQKQLFSYFVPVRGMSEQIVEVLDNDRRERRGGTSRTGNILVIGHKGSGKTVLAVDMVKAIQKQRNLKQGKVAIVTGESLNKKDIPNIIQKLRGGAIIIEKAGKLNARTVRELNILMEKKTGELLFVLEDQKKALERLFTANPEFKKKFTSRLELPVFINDELVTFGQTYAKENGYKLDEMGILALYSRIDVMQREDHAVSVAEVKEIMDAAIEHSQKANVKHLARRMFRKGTDESDRIILKEDDFRI